MAEAILNDKKLIVPAAAYMQGEYGLDGIFFGAPVQLGRNGIERIIEYSLDESEKEALTKSAAAVRSTTEALLSLIEL
jgi:malate dehydrogenase